MTNEQNTAYVIAQAACDQAEIAAMQAENAWLVQNGNSIAYGEEAFNAISHNYCISHNAVIELFQA